MHMQEIAPNLLAHTPLIYHRDKFLTVGIVYYQCRKTFIQDSISQLLKKCDRNIKGNIYSFQNLLRCHYTTIGEAVTLRRKRWCCHQCTHINLKGVSSASHGIFPCHFLYRLLSQVKPISWICWINSDGHISGHGDVNKAEETQLSRDREGQKHLNLSHVLCIDWLKTFEKHKKRSNGFLGISFFTSIDV